MRIRKITEDDYDIILPWYLRWKWPYSPTPEMLSSHGYAAMVGDEIAAAIWIFPSEGGWAWLEFLVANPDMRGPNRVLATDFLMREIQEIAKSLGATRVLTATIISQLAKRWQDAGLNIAGKDIIHLAKGL